MFYMDPLYLVLMLIGAPLAFIPQWWVKKTYRANRDIRTQQGQSGATVAKMILERNGLHNVEVEETPGELSDHYDPRVRKVRLSPDNYRGASVAAAAIAAHEVGHAIQHAKGYYPVVLRSQLAPLFGLGSQLGPMLFFASFLLYGFMGLSGELAYFIAMAGVGLFGLTVVFHMVTLPVEFDASARALKALKVNHYLSEPEMTGAKKVLTAAAMTYVSVALYSLLQLGYYLIKLNSMRSRN